MVDRSMTASLVSRLGCLLAPLLIGVVSPLALAEEQSDRGDLHEPVFRVSKTATSTSTSKTGDRIDGELGEAVDNAPHPLDPALEMARRALDHIEVEIRDYTCVLVKRERVQGVLLDHEFLKCKLRHECLETGGSFGVYLNFRKPDSVRGREVIYVENQNNGKMIAHEGGLRGKFLPTVTISPTSVLAMKGNRYPITEIGIKTLTKRLIEKGERDKKAGDCEVRMVDGVKVKDRECTMLEVKHQERKPQYDFHVARVYLDKELQVPIRYEAYDWPTAEGAEMPLLEEYTYMRLKLNVGLTDLDFDKNNKSYRF